MERVLSLFILALAVIIMPVDFAGADENSGVLSLEEVLQEVIERNPEISAARASSTIAKERSPQARALDDPIFGITRWEFPANFNILKANETWYTLSQSFPFFGKRTTRGRVADLESDAAEEASRAVRLRMIAQAKQAYYDLFLAHQVLQIYHDQVNLARRISQAAEERFAVGGAGQSDLIRARVELITLSNAILTLEQERESAAARLNALLNRPTNAPLGIPQTPVLPRFEANPEKLQSEAEEARPENRMKALAVQLGQERVTLSKQDALPDFMAEVGFMDMHDQDHNAWMASVRINLPWFNKKKYDARIRENEAERSRAKAAHQAAVNDTRLKIKELWVRFEAAKRLVRLYEEGIRPLAEQTLEAALIGYQTRKNDFLTLLDAQRNLKELELTYFRSLAEANKHLAELEQIVGREF